MIDNPKLVQVENDTWNAIAGALQHSNIELQGSLEGVATRQMLRDAIAASCT